MSFGRLRQRIVLKFVPHVQHDYLCSFNQSDHCFLALSLSLPSSLLKFSTKKLTSPSVVIPSAKMKNEKTEGQRWKCQLSSTSFDGGNLTFINVLDETLVACLTSLEVELM